ncbi:Membrane dipeptidase (Peptidase family M19) [Tritonibacter multivorans]|uniref:Membrane dipeptidase (Peptidase family M19) n=1 Tax=Tritonibacter multivorans TaxID=928856 RepID=A0A0P1G0P3_9RHOB|nr:membrane dipeptidase [Tritonibacter multivorans]MDA7419293.1 membrane dipeptidase [Tritonibacter multivorans]CUH75170.1 Membrane dipeptidase (Peptidase family M19) [Tritonibacter multivorans]SFD23341.1 Zn-dependent dipeptidase, dipeptidase homolog [Tritonibacter multivorans]
MRRLMRLLTRLLILVAVLAGAALVFGPKALDQQLNRVTPRSDGPVPSPETASLHQNLQIADLSAATTLWRRDLSRDNTRGHVDLPRLERGNVTLQVFSVVTSAPAPRWLGRNGDLDGASLLAMIQLWPLPSWRHPFNRAAVQARLLHQAQEAGGGGLRILRTRADLETLLRRKSASGDVIGGLLALDGASALQGQIRNLDPLYQGGYRMVGLADPLRPALPPTNGSLSTFERQLLAEADRRGMVVNLAGLSPAKIRAALSETLMPMVLTTGAPQPGCAGHLPLPEDLLVDFTRHGGVIGVPFAAPASGSCDTTATSIAQSLRATLDLVGDTHVALASGFDSAQPVPFDAAGLPQLTQALRDAGLSPEQIENVMGGNVIRLLRQRLP